CVQCREKMWISENLLADLGDQPFKPMCNFCFGALVAAGGEEITPRPWGEHGRKALEDRGIDPDAALAAIEDIIDGAEAARGP
ncbi:hypothetical protein LCGC14_3071310, partial [marine sediment metagenome]